jgi:hypothetical protein
MRELGRKRYGGSVSYAGKLRIERRFEAWYHFIEAMNRNKKITGEQYFRRFVLITLTLPSTQFHSDKELKAKALKPFVQNLVRNHDLRLWMWKAEAQDNGNIHFHVVVDKYIWKDELNKLWEHYMRKLGYYFKFKQKYPNAEPPMVNVKGQSKMRNPVAYLTKYMIKDETKREIDGALWRMSDDLVQLRPFVYEAEKVVRSKIENQVKKGIVKKVIHDWAIVYIYHHKVDPSEISQSFKILHNQYYDNQVKTVYRSEADEHLLKEYVEAIEEEKRLNKPISWKPQKKPKQLQFFNYLEQTGHIHLT